MERKLEIKLDAIFSKYIRLKNSDDEGFCYCVTCSKQLFWNSIHCGHFISRRHKATRYYEKNVAPQCAYCNNFCHGQQWLFGQKIDKKYGQDAALKIYKRATEGIVVEPTPFEVKHWQQVTIEKLDYLSKKSWMGPTKI